MKINGIPRMGGANPYARQDQKPTDVKAKRDHPKDEVRISPQAQELLEARGAADSRRTEKLQELKEAVSSGTYHVEAKQIAEKLLPYLD